MSRFLLESGGALLLESGGAFLLEAYPPAFPDIPLDLRLEVNAGGTWTDLSSRLDHPPIVITRGHPDESATVSPAVMDAELTNSDAALSPDNPGGPYWPWLVQNMPGRVSIPAASPYLRSETDTASGAVTFASGLNVSGDFDVRADMTPDGAWTQGMIIAGYWDAPANLRSWLFAVNPDGTLAAAITSGGTMATYQQATSTAPVAAQATGRMSVRAVYARTAGTVAFYTSTGTIAGGGSPSWTQLGATVQLTSAAVYPVPGLSAGYVQPGTDFSSAWLPYQTPWAVFVNPWPGYSGRYHALQLYNAGTLAASPDWSVQTSATFTDAQGNSWAANGTAELSTRSYRGHFEIAEWPQDEPPYNPAGGTIGTTVKIAGGGLLRRLGQRNSPVNSAVYRACRVLASSPGLAGAWTMEDAAGSSSLASAIGGPAMTWTGSPALASNSTAFAGATALPVCNGATFTARVPYYSPGWTDNVARLLIQLPAGEAAGAVIASMRTSGTVARADLVYGVSSGAGTIGMGIYNAAGTLLASTATLTPFTATSGLNGQDVRVSMVLQANGSSVNYWIEVLRTDGTVAETSASASVTGTVGQVLDVVLNPGGVLLGTVYGGVTVQPLWTTPSDIIGAVSGWPGEPAGYRIARLCSEEGIPFRGRGNLAATTLMGVQVPQTLVQLVQACADADTGEWTELRQALGWGYTTRQALYNQAARVTVTYAQDHLSVWVSPPQRDDQYISNDVTVTNASGSSARQYAAPGQPVPGGRLSTLKPGTGGVGTYDGGAASVAVWHDSDLPNLAGWRLHLGTVDQARFPGIVLDLSNRLLSSVFDDITGLDLGQRIVIDAPPERWGTGSVSQLAQQLTETLGPYEYTVAVTGVPELPYETCVIGTSRIDTDGTTLGSAYVPSNPAFTLVIGSGDPLWTVSGGDFPFTAMAGGEEVMVTAITGASSPQGAIVARSVNGVVKELLGGTALNVWPPPVIAL